ncbi:unnamed protein product [Caenorhabditis auriculariae]|uniref:Uncharacterized protein n=1 Tax=Caenorhabditis auriculariae TaxID=2777116 RepID=A0A8S1HG94_9PELO|nr:unnamed protein product [Caenorhabditis auriculariae]
MKLLIVVAILASVILAVSAFPAREKRQWGGPGFGGGYGGGYGPRYGYGGYGPRYGGWGPRYGGFGRGRPTVIEKTVIIRPGI